MFCKEKHDIIIEATSNEYYAYFNYDFVEATTQEMDSEGNLQEISGYECVSYGKKFVYYPSEEELIRIYHELATNYKHLPAKEPTIFIKEG